MNSLDAQLVQDVHHAQDVEDVQHCSHGSLTSLYGWTIQCVLASIAFACLIVKRFCEPKRYRRSWIIWFFDTSKQGFGAIAVHFSNIILAELFEGRDPCTLYIISFLLDSSIGLLLIYGCIRLTQSIAVKYNYRYLIFGEYGKPKPLLKFWILQCFAYIIIVLFEKLVITLLLRLKFWDYIRNIILWPISRSLNKEMEIFLVILVIPFFVNVLMFWVTDNFLIMHRVRQLKRNNISNDVILTFSQQPIQANADNCHTSDDDAELIDISFEPEPQDQNVL